MGYLVVEHGNRLSETYKEIDNLSLLLKEHYELQDDSLVLRVFYDIQGTPHLLRGWEIELQDEQVVMLKILYPLIVGYLE